MKLRIENQWEFLSYYINNKNITDNLKDVEVEWPDGHREIYNIRYETDFRTCYDMGHEYSVENKVPFLSINYHGLQLKTKLTADMNIISYKLREV